MESVLTGLAIEEYLAIWMKALFSETSQPAISNMVSILSAEGLPKLTVESLLAALVNHYGDNPAVDMSLIDFLPSGRWATTLDLNQKVSYQLADLLAKFLLSLSSQFFGGGFLYMARGGQLMNSTTEVLTDLLSRLSQT